MKYKVMRLIDKSKQKVVAVEFGNNINEVIKDIIRDVNEDLEFNPKYKGCDTSANIVNGVLVEPEPGSVFGLGITGMVYPPNAPENILVDYAVFAESE